MIFSAYQNTDIGIGGVSVVSSGHIFAHNGRKIDRPSGRPDYLLLYIAKGKEHFFLNREIIAEEEGYVSRIICDNVGLSAMVLGGGRENKDSIIDLSVGIVLHKKKGDYVKVGDSIATFYANDEKKLADGIERFKGAYIIDKSAPDKKTLIQYIVTDKELLSFI